MASPQRLALVSELGSTPAKVQAVAFVSPTCDICIAGAEMAGAGLLNRVPDMHLAFHYVWVPVLETDSLDEAVAAATRFADPRADHWWDEGAVEAIRMAGVLGIKSEESGSAKRSIAWDVYLAYRRGHDLGDEPDFWMHQLGVKHAPRLDPEVWRTRIEALLHEV